MHHLLYAITLLISSSMLFIVQPMVAKMVQPVLGGTPAVWNTAMLFFQALLLGGYFYAHATTKWLGTRRQAIMHLVVLVIGLIFLPISFSPPSDPAALEHPALWLLITLSIGVGWPFFVISTSAPLLQRWFSTIDHPHAADPYHLYAASNIGSIVALVGYPFLIEPLIGVQAQTILWLIAYIILAISVAGCAYILWKSPPRDPTPDHSENPPASATPLTWRRRLRWTLWAFIPSSMMLSVTTFITTDVAPLPLLWIPPLAIFIFSFVLVFAKKTYIPFRAWTFLFPIFLITLTVLFTTEIAGHLLAISTIANFVGLLVFCMVFHSLFANDRPHTDHLTEFYLLMSLGGALGGVFNALIAPVLFDSLFEYPIVILIAALAFPAHHYRNKDLRISLFLAIILAIISIYFFIDHQSVPGDPTRWLAFIFYAVFLTPLLVALYKPQATPFAIALFTIFFSYEYLSPPPGELFRARSFFSTHQVTETVKDDYLFRSIHHGRTMHGRQFFGDDQLHRLPVAYYYIEGPLGQLFHELKSRGEELSVAVVGLGAGGISTYADHMTKIDFYEIDPVVRDIAQDPDLFTYLADCGSNCEVIMGDGRLQLQAIDDASYDLIILDAYSSTAVPLHLLTREAIELYAQKLRPCGILAFQISNRHLNLEPPLTAVAADLGYSSRTQMESLRTEYIKDRPFYAGISDWVLIAKESAHLGALEDDERWVNYQPQPNFRVWTDDYANILKVIKAFQKEKK